MNQIYPGEIFLDYIYTFKSEEEFKNDFLKFNNDGEYKFYFVNHEDLENIIRGKNLL